MSDPHVTALNAYHKARSSRQVTAFPITMRMLTAYAWSRYWERWAMRKAQKMAAAEAAAPEALAPDLSPEAEARNMLKRV